jgi:hypothetical protein
MTESEVSKPEPLTSSTKATVGRLFILGLSGGRVFSLNTGSSDQKVIVSGCRHPDGIVVDVEAGDIYWTNMGVPNLNDGSTERGHLDGQNRKMIVPEGATYTPKQLNLDKKNRRPNRIIRTHCMNVYPSICTMSPRRIVPPRCTDA